MTDATQFGPQSLSGLWHGQFTYPRLYASVFFTATLLETPDRLSGAIEEVARNGGLKGKKLYAALDGRRRGHSVTFRKRYEGPAPVHNVLYDGTVNGDASEIEGIWRIPGNWSGRFLMLRMSGPAAAADQDVAEKSPG